MSDKARGQGIHPAKFCPFDFSPGLWNGGGGLGKIRKDSLEGKTLFKN